MPMDEILERQKAHRLPKNVFVRSAVYSEDSANYKGLLLNSSYRQLIKNQCIKMGIQLLVIDNKKSFHPGLEENGNGGPWDDVNSWMMDLRNIGINIILITHAGKDESKGTRGSSSTLDNVDIEIQLKDKKKSNKSENVAFTCNFNKCRFKVPAAETKPIEFSFRENEDRKHEWFFGIDNDSLKEEIEDLIDKGLTYKQISKELDIATGTISNIVNGK
jgi:hypothetical protein